MQSLVERRHQVNILSKSLHKKSIKNSKARLLPRKQVETQHLKPTQWHIQRKVRYLEVHRNLLFLTSSTATTGTSGDSGGQQYHPAAATEPPASHRTPSHGKDSKRTTQEQHSRPHAGSEKQRPKLATVTVIKEQYDVHSDEDDEDKKAGDAAGPYKTSGRAPASLSGYAPISSSRPSGRPADVTTYQDTSGQAFHTRSGTEYESASTTGNQVSRGSRRGTTPAAGKTTPRSVRSEKRSNYLLVLRPVHSPDTREERVGPTTGVTSRTSSVTPPARSYEEAVGSSAGAIVTGRPLAANAKVLRNLKQLEDMALELKENLIKQGVKQMKQMTTRRRSRAGVRYEMMQPPVYHSIITSKEQDKNEISKMASGADVQRKTAFAPETSGHRHRIRPNSHSPQESRKQLLKSASHLTMKQAPQVPDDDDDDEYGDPVETDILSNTSGQRASSLQGMEKDHLMTTPHAITNNQTPQSNAQPVRSFVKIRYQATGRETSHENTHRDSTKSLNSSNARHTIRSSSIMEPFSPDYQ